MPAVSQAQRRFIFAHFGKAWAAKHHFNNEGPLPARAVQARTHARRRHLAPTVHALGRRRKIAARNARLAIIRTRLGARA